MRKLKLQVQMSIDGFIGGAEGQMDWLVMNWSDDIKKYVEDITEPVDTIILGRNLAEGFIPHWAAVAADTDHPENSAGRKYSETKKIVFSNSLKSSPWSNTSVARGDLKKEVLELKKMNGNDIIAYGGSRFVSALIKEKLIDELHLFVNPVVIGRGMPIFGDVNTKQFYKPVDVQSFDCGIVMIQYNFVRDSTTGL